MMAEDNQSIAAIVKRARAIKGISQPELARRVGTSQQTIDKIETGKVQRSSFLAAIALELGVPLDRVLRVRHKSGGVAELAGHTLISGHRDLPVYAAAAQVDDNGVQVLSSDPVEYVARPEPLARVRDGYGVIVADDSMTPEARSGDIALVNPHLPARVGDTCVFRSGAQDGGMQRCVIKHLRRVTDKDWHVTEWSGPDGGRRDFTLKRPDWPVAHVTIGYFKRR
jgi:transcriptional regulator with XRE-family HTH domain